MSDFARSTRAGMRQYLQNIDCNTFVHTTTNVAEVHYDKIY